MASSKSTTYLNEFVFRYNRRFYRHVSFETILGLSADHAPMSYWEIIKRDNPRKGRPVNRKSPRQRKTQDGVQIDGTGPKKRRPKPDDDANGSEA